MIVNINFFYKIFFFFRLKPKKYWKCQYSWLSKKHLENHKTKQINCRIIWREPVRKLTDRLERLGYSLSTNSLLLINKFNLLGVPLIQTHWSSVAKIHKEFELMNRYPFYLLDNPIGEFVWIWNSQHLFHG